MTRRDFGTTRRLPSGRWQARFSAPDGSRLAAERTFATRAEAASYLSGVQADEGLLKRHLLPHLATVPLARLTPAVVRRWHAGRLQAGVGRSTVAKAYRLLKTILNTAVADEVLVRNPCLLRGAGSERTPERVPPTLLEAHALADAIQPRWRMLVLLATWSGLRWGELVALRRDSVDLTHGRLTVTDQLVETAHGVQLGPPKTDAGRRTVHLPPHVLPELTEHLDRWVGPAPDAWLFCGPLGAPLVRRNFTVHWTRCRADVGLPTIRFHDLRHLSATLAATTGATTRELMARMGHSSPRAALIYQHAAADRDRAVAEAMSALAPTPALPVGERPSRRRKGAGRGQLSLTGT
jgi:integrase